MYKSRRSCAVAKSLKKVAMTSKERTAAFRQRQKEKEGYNSEDERRKTQERVRLIRVRKK